MHELIQKQDKNVHVVMLNNASGHAKDEMWPG